jgi:hypothetical protein
MTYRIVQLVRAWWNGADERSLTRLLRAAGIYFLVWMVLPLIGIDRLTTVDNSTMLSVTISGVACGLGAIFGWRAWFRPQNDNLVGARKRMKQDQRARWIAAGILSVLLPALILTYATDQFTAVAAQLLPGDVLRYSGTVTKIHHAIASRSLCRVVVSIELDNAHGNATFCLTIAGASVSDSISLAVGDAVILNEKRGAFGQAVESVEYAH